MEQKKQNLLEIIDRPAFLVRDGVITECNQMAKNRQLSPGISIADLLATQSETYHNYSGGILYLTLQVGLIPCGATVLRQECGDLFLMERESEQAQLQALALAAQQLRTPLSNAITLADSLLPSLTERTQKQQAGQMCQSLFQLMRIIANMADSARYHNLETPHYENTELCGFFAEILEKANSLLENTGNFFHYSCPKQPVFTMLDRERMERAVYNLLSNAVKFSEPKTQIDVRLTVSGKAACLTVENQGAGIADHVQSTLFQRYMREPGIEDSRFGLGLGMTLIRSAAAIHDGTVLLEQADRTRVAVTMALRNDVPHMLRSPRLRIGDYAGGRDTGLLELSDLLPSEIFEKNL